MATLDGVEVTPCERCNAPLGASEYVVTKGTAQVRRNFCEKCAETTAETYPVKPSRQPAKANPRDEKPRAAAESASASEKEE